MDQTTKNREFVKRHFEAVNRQTDRPEAIDQYTLLHLVGDMVGLLDAIDQETAVIAGHDWGVCGRRELRHGAR